MRWKGRRRSTNVRDTRGSGGGGMLKIPTGRRGGGIQIPMGGGSRRAGSGLGCGTMIVIGIVLYMLGINPMTLLGSLGGGLGSGLNPQSTPNFERKSDGAGRNDEMREFVEVILNSTEEVWSGIFKSYGKRYPPPVLEIFEGQVQSACGIASAASGPFYCPADKKAYIDFQFYDDLVKKFGAKKGDFAEAYVLAHEVGHHVQNVIGVLPQFNRMRRNMRKLEVNKLSTKVELQADCFAGVWGHYVQREGWLEEGDLEEALIAANQIGDDTIQRRTQGYVVPESFNHGTSEQRRRWFRRGFKHGRMEACDTFNERNL